MAEHADAGLKIYYIRHAEAGHNVDEEWEVIPKKKWPSFVGDSQQFTPKGETQRHEAVKMLERIDLDFIAVSPMWRTRNTILPYLKATEQKAEIWPELHEVYCSSVMLSEDLPKHHGKILGEGDRIELSSREEDYFSLRPDGKREFELPDFDDDHEEKEAEAAAARVVVEEVLELVKERFSGSDKSILLVGHGSSGKGILRLFLNDRLSGFPSLTNAGLWMIEETEDGVFELKMFNNVPLP